MAELRKSILNKVSIGAAVLACLTPGLVLDLVAGDAFAQGAPGAPGGPAAAQGYGPYAGAAHAGGHSGRAWREGYCGERQSIQAPDVMTYDRNTGSEVLVGDGPSGHTAVTGLNRETGTTFAVKGDLTSPETTSMCTTNGVTGSAYAVSGEGAKTVVKGQDGATGRRFEVAQAPGGHGPDFKSADPATRREVSVTTGPDGRSEIHEFGPHALACTRARLGLDAGVKAEVGDLKAGVGGKGGVTISLGDC
jgi:hypothetical protein